MKRLLASVLLGALILSVSPAHVFAADCTGHGRPVAPDANVPALSQMQHHDCEHAARGPCWGALHCVSVVPAVLATVAEFVIPVPPGVAVSAAGVSLAGRPALGPPTPPPNF